MNPELEAIISSPGSPFFDVSGLNAISVFLRFTAAALLGFVIGGVFRVSHGANRNKMDHAMFTTLVLLTVLICMVTTVVGNSVARAFSLAGALAIVRFRTVVEDTRDTAFVVFAVVIGMAIGCDYWLVPTFGIPIVSAAAITLRWMSPKSSVALAYQTPDEPSLIHLKIRSALGVDVNKIIAQTMSENVITYRCTEAEIAKQGAAIDAVYIASLRPGADLIPLVGQLNRLEGIQSASVQSLSSLPR